MKTKITLPTELFLNVLQVIFLHGCTSWSLFSRKMFPGIRPGPISHSSSCVACGLVSTSCCTYMAVPLCSCGPLCLCTNSYSYGKVSFSLGQPQRRESGCADGFGRVQRRRGGWKERRRVSVPLRGVHWTGQRHVSHMSGHRQNTTR